MSASDYNKWDKLDYEINQDDCHPNINNVEINKWRCLKERKRREEGKIKKEPVINDKWNTTSVNTKVKDERIDKSIDKQPSNVKKNEEPELIGVNGIPESKRYMYSHYMYSKEKPSQQKGIEQNPFAKKYNYKPKQPDTKPKNENNNNTFTNGTKNNDNKTENTSNKIYGIEQRRIERIEEAEEKLKNDPENIEQNNVNDKAPVGPGGLDNTQVLNLLPEEMQKAFFSLDIDKVNEEYDTDSNTQSSVIWLLNNEYRCTEYNSTKSKNRNCLFCGKILKPEEYLGSQTHEAECPGV